MENSFQKIECNDNDVISFLGDYTYKVAKIKRAFVQVRNTSIGNLFHHELKNKGIILNLEKLHPKGYHSACEQWLNEGIDCEILNVGASAWKKGKMKIKISVEFVIEEDNTTINNETNFNHTPPESPLDDLRQMMIDN
ncbi:KGK domain-containing protein [Calothrix sp. PCC 6303]|uniref:KGK domain-containing protein n=1 Tax=Calothrix sp. PCC 6303 TaxID=1170562 RepID=UPI0002A0256E|nr:KGK domain-containing protein [Calothrix sp. PCC 6303]AFZ01910.1 KGK family protein [Calothrix sp. PCC 6303]